LFLNISFSSVYRLVPEAQKEILDLMSASAEEENHSKGCKKLAELDKEYFSCYSAFCFTSYVVIEKSYFPPSVNLLVFYPEKVSPPPQAFFS
ncbi:MAG TPA: hypothetical protein VD908_03455, partial [Cytophagales bacterium]|nr:hypothetical protein [Cytophagales bacterium]